MLRRLVTAAGLVISLAACGGPELGSTAAGSGAGGSGPTSSGAGGTITTTATGEGGMSTSGSGGDTGTSTTSDCPPAGLGPAADSYPAELGGQSLWVHDGGFASGYFHTYDALAVGGPGDVPRKVHVFLPVGYAESCEHYPVVYMNDGNTTFWPGGAGNKSWNVAQGLAQLYAEGAIAPVIVVAIHPVNREAEYTHTDWAPGHPCCGAKGYADYVADRVKPFIDAGYRTRPQREHTAIVGSSHGGLAAFLLGGLRPDRFGMAGCLSSSFWAGLDPVHQGSFSGGPLATSALLDLTKATLSDPALRPRLWLDWGLVRSGGFHNEVIEAAATVRGKEMVALLGQSYGYVEGDSLFWAEDPDGEHDEDSWAARFPAVMKAFFAGP